ncbi:hypothetical protein ACR79P_06480 [Sphingobacterium spiritivorum]|uniref:hypothetical protein n=1 Tax=Sphingobacterium spiritivorum TaxID=258 RepID=UPI003DA270DA
MKILRINILSIDNKVIGNATFECQISVDGAPDFRSVLNHSHLQMYYGIGIDIIVKIQSGGNWVEIPFHP